MNENLLDIGPNQADAIRNYEVEGKKIFYENDYWKKILFKSTNSNTSNLFVGRRGSGKTMLLRESVRRINKVMKELDKDKYQTDLVIPVSISFTAFLNKYSFPSIGSFKEDHKEIMNELFNGYFYLLVIKNIFESIKNLRLEPEEEEISLYDIQVSLKKDHYKGLEIIKELIRKLKIRVLPKKVIENISKKDKIGFDKVITFTHGKGRDRKESKFEFAKAPQYPYFEYAIEAIMEVYNFRRILFFFDEITGLGHLQSQFFDALYLFRDNADIHFKVFNYPQFYDYGSNFDPSDDAPITSLDRELWKPDKSSFYEYFQKIIEIRLKTYSQINSFKSVIDEKTLKLMALCCGGNTRLFLNLFNLMNQREGKINNTSLNNIIDDFVELYYENFMRDNSSRVGLEIDNVRKILNQILNKVKDRNDTASIQSNLVLFEESDYLKFKEIFELLVYSRILDSLGKKTVGGRKAYRFYLNTAVCAFNNCFSSPPGARQLFIGLDEELHKAKIDNYKIKIPFSALDDDFIEDYKKGIIDMIDQGDREISIDELDIRSRPLNALKKNSNIKTVSEILKWGEQRIKNEIEGIGTVYAAEIYSAAKEIISDRDSILISLQPN